MKKKMALLTILILLCSCNNSISSSTSSKSSLQSIDISTSNIGTSSKIDSSSLNTSSEQHTSSNEEKKSFMIYYDLGGVNDAHIEGLSQEVIKGEEFNYYVPYHKNYIFNCWFLKNTTQKFNSGIFNYDKDIYLIASWSEYSHDSSWTSNY